jgi:uncharacterized protein YkwD
MTTQTKLTKILLTFLAAAALSLTGCNSVNSDTTETQAAPKVQNQNQSSNVSTQTGTDKTQVDAANAKNQSTQEDDNQQALVSKVSEADKQAFLDAINAARAETQDCGDQGVFDPAPALSWNDMLGNAAYEHSYDLAQSDTFSHTGSGTASDATAQEEHLGRGSDFRERIEHNGYTQWRSIGENIAAGQRDVDEVINAWLQSPHHCANMMNPKFKEVGMALVEKESSKYYQYWSQEFGGK